MDVNGVQDVGVSSVAWASATLATFGRKNGLVTVAKLDYVSSHASVTSSTSLSRRGETNLAS